MKPEADNKKWSGLKLGKLLTPKRRSKGDSQLAIETADLSAPETATKSKAIRRTHQHDDTPTTPARNVLGRTSYSESEIPETSSTSIEEKNSTPPGDSRKQKRRPSVPFDIIRQRMFSKKSAKNAVEPPQDANDLSESFRIESIFDSTNFTTPQQQRRPSMVRPPSMSNVYAQTPVPSLPLPASEEINTAASNKSTKPGIRMEVKLSPKPSPKTLKTDTPNEELPPSDHSSSRASSTAHPTLSQKLMIGQMKGNNSRPPLDTPRSPRPMFSGARPVVQSNTPTTIDLTDDCSDASPFNPTLSQKLKIGMKRSESQKSSIAHLHLSMLSNQNSLQILAPLPPDGTNGLGNSGATGLGSSGLGASNVSSLSNESRSTLDTSTLYSPAKRTSAPSPPLSSNHSSSGGSPTTHSKASHSARRHQRSTDGSGRPPVASSTRSRHNSEDNHTPRSRSRTPESAPIPLPPGESLSKSPHRRRQREYSSGSKYSDKSRTESSTTSSSMRSRHTCSDDSTRSRNRTLDDIAEVPSADTPQQPSPSHRRRWKEAMSVYTSPKVSSNRDGKQESATPTNSTRSRHTCTDDTARSRSKTPEGHSASDPIQKSPSHRRRWKDASSISPHSPSVKNLESRESNRSLVPSQSAIVDSQSEPRVVKRTSSIQRTHRDENSRSRSRTPEGSSRASSGEMPLRSPTQERRWKDHSSYSPSSKREESDKVDNAAKPESRRSSRSTRHGRSESDRKGTREREYRSSRARGGSSSSSGGHRRHSSHHHSSHHARHSRESTSRSSSKPNHRERRRSTSREDSLAHSNTTKETMVAENSRSTGNSADAEKLTSSDGNINGKRVSWDGIAMSEALPVGLPREQSSETTASNRVLSKAELDRREGATPRTPTTRHRTRLGPHGQSSPSKDNDSPLSVASQGQSGRRRSSRDRMRNAIAQPQVASPLSRSPRKVAGDIDRRSSSPRIPRDTQDNKGESKENMDKDKKVPQHDNSTMKTREKRESGISPRDIGASTPIRRRQSIEHSGTPSTPISSRTSSAGNASMYSPNLTEDHYKAVNVMAAREFFSPLGESISLSLPPIAYDSNNNKTGMSKTETLKSHLRQLEELNRVQSRLHGSLLSQQSGTLPLAEGIQNQSGQNSGSQHQLPRGSRASSSRSRRTQQVSGDKTKNPDNDIGFRKRNGVGEDVDYLVSDNLNTSPVSDDSATQRLGGEFLPKSPTTRDKRLPPMDGIGAKSTWVKPLQNKDVRDQASKAKELKGYLGPTSDKKQGFSSCSVPASECTTES